MTKILTTIAALAICTALFAGCSDSPAAPPKNNQGGNQVQEGTDKPVTNNSGWKNRAVLITGPRAATTPANRHRRQR